MRSITLRAEYATIEANEGRCLGARREWTVTGQLDIYLDGPFDKLQYAQATNIACNIALEMNIPLTQLVRVVTANVRTLDTKTKRMF